MIKRPFLKKAPDLLLYLLTLVSSIFLAAGVYLPMLNIKLTTFVDAGLTKFDNTSIDKTRSILGTVFDLYKDQRPIVAGNISMVGLATR